MKLDLLNLWQQHNITPRGIISVGGCDRKTFKRLNLSDTVKTLLIDANPKAVELLQTSFADSPNTQVIQAAISNHNDTVTLHLTSLESNSSILPWKQYSEIYPNIKETQQLTLPSHTLDSLLEELHLSPSDFNILILDLQGAELLALEGATQLLNTLDVIYTTVHYQELFEGGALAEQVGQFLADYQFHPVAEASPYHPAWGEALYFRQTIRNGDQVHPVKPLSPTAQLFQETQQQLETLQSQYQEVLVTLEQTQVQLQQSTENLAELQAQRDQILTALEQTQTELQQSQSQHQQIQTQLEQTQTELQQSQSQLEQTQKESDQSRSELHETREELELTQFQLDEVQVELEQYVAQYHQMKEEFQQTQDKLQRTQLELEQLKTQQPEVTTNKRSKSSNTALVKVLAQVLAETLDEN